MQRGALRKRTCEGRVRVRVRVPTICWGGMFGRLAYVMYSMKVAMGSTACTLRKLNSSTSLS